MDRYNKSFTVAFYEGGGIVRLVRLGNADVTIMIYGSEFGKGTNGMVESLEAEDEIFDNKPIIIKDKYAVSGSDMAQIGWVEVTTENGASGYLWYLKSEHETRLRFEDYLETAMIEAVPAEAGSGASGCFRLEVLKVFSLLSRIEETYSEAVTQPLLLNLTQSSSDLTSKVLSRRMLFS
jgi:hypothetical protein